MGGLTPTNPPRYATEVKSLEHTVQKYLSLEIT